MTIGISSITLAHDHDLVAARQRARQIATTLGFDAQDQTRIATVVSETARNVIRYAKSGKIEFGIAPGDVALLVITVTDRGPGIADLEMILAGKYVSKSGMGIGITGARRLMDDFQITSSSDNGTTVRMSKIIPRRGGIRPDDIERISRELVRQTPQSPLDELAEAMARGARMPYDPQALGIRSAREAVARELACDAEDIVITASTSEAYSFLFKLLTEPGDEIAIAVPSYPLLEHLAAMELVTLRPFALEFHGRWEMTEPDLTPRTRVIAVVNPNNPTGSFARAGELAAIAKRPLILDEMVLAASRFPGLTVPKLEEYKEFLGGSQGKDMSTTMAVVRLIDKLCRDDVARHPADHRVRADREVCRVRRRRRRVGLDRVRGHVRQLGVADRIRRHARRARRAGRAGRQFQAS